MLFETKDEIKYLVVSKGSEELTKATRVQRGIRAFIHGVRKEFDGKGLEDDENITEVVCELMGKAIVRTVCWLLKNIILEILKQQAVSKIIY